MGKIEFLKVILTKSTSNKSNNYKPIILLLIISLLTGVLLTSCKDEVTQPTPKPPGYQEDIPWPSLANSPWPMCNHDPQNTNRGLLNNQLEGKIEWKIKLPQIGSNEDTFLSAVISYDSTILVVSFDDVEHPNSFLYAFTYTGKIKWKFPLPFNDPPTSKNTTPAIVRSDGVLYTADWNKNIYAINGNGTLRWQLKLNENILGKMNIDRAGNLYCVGQLGNVYAISNEGIILWSLNLVNTSAGSHSSISFSPDGNTIYASTNRVSAIKKDGTLKWETDVGANSIFHLPLIDNEGNIYFYFTSSTDTIFGLKSIDKNSNVRYFYTEIKFVWDDLTIDKRGNIYIPNEPDIISLDYLGNFRWRLQNIFKSSSLSCDKMGRIYFIDGLGNLKCINDVGQFLWEITDVGLGTETITLSDNRLYFGAKNDSGKYFYCIK